MGDRNVYSKILALRPVSENVHEQHVFYARIRSAMHARMRTGESENLKYAIVCMIMTRWLINPPIYRQESVPGTQNCKCRCKIVPKLKIKKKRCKKVPENVLKTMEA